MSTITDMGAMILTQETVVTAARRWVIAKVDPTQSADLSVRERDLIAAVYENDKRSQEILARTKNP